MDLNILWFVLIAVLFVGFFFLEGFDYGVGILLPFLGKNDTERRMIINSIGPHWDGNEVWMLTAAGAIFAAFPHWYATMFSGFYLAFVLMLLALISRAVAFEFRSKDDSPRWRAMWDWVIFLGSLVPAILWGVALSNLIRGVPIDGEMHYVGSFFDLLNPYSLLGGLLTLALFTLHGAAFLTLKVGEGIDDRARAIARRVWPVACVIGIAFTGWGYVELDVVGILGVNPGVVPIVALLSLLSVGWFLAHRWDGTAFLVTGSTIIFLVLTVFVSLFPNVMVSSLDPGWNLTIYNASASHYTLSVLSIVALTLVPVVVIYQGWSYWVFRHRITQDTHLEY